MLATLVLHGMNEAYWLLWEDPDTFLIYDFATGTMRGYLAERLALVKHQEVGDGIVVPVFEPAVAINRSPDMTSRTISDVEYHYQRYHSVDDVDGDPSADIPTSAFDNLNYFAWGKLRKTGGGSCFMSSDSYVISMALRRLQRLFRLQVPSSVTSYIDSSMKPRR